MTAVHGAPVIIGPSALAIRAAGGSASVVASGLSGLEVAGTVGGIIGVLAAVVTLWVTISASNRAKRREYMTELRQARADGADEERRTADARIRNLVDELKQARHERDFFRNRYFSGGGRQLPPPREDDPQ